MLLRSLKRLRRTLDSSYTPLIEVRILQRRLLDNLRFYQFQNPSLQIAPVLKSNAYGHGLVEVAHILKRESLPFFVVDSFYEARVLRKSGIKIPILILGYNPVETLLGNRDRTLHFTITSLDQIRELAERLRLPQFLHLKLDTGMHRQGISQEEVPFAIELIQRHPMLRLKGLCSHFADADTPDSSFTMKQINAWNLLVDHFSRHFHVGRHGLEFFHLSATEGISYSQAKATMARVGMGLYLHRPALELHTVVSGLLTIGAGEGVGYNVTFTSPEAMRLATLPLGYFEGMDRRLSNQGYVQIQGQFCPIVGRVSMNITTVDVSSLSVVKRGESVTVISSNPEDLNSVQAMSKICGTTPREILVHIPPHLRRVLV